MNRFQKKLNICGVSALKRERIEIIQVNLGKLCNLNCVHCHVEAGPTKTRENMGRSTAEAAVRLMDRMRPALLDLTGGAPEMNPHFRYLVEEAVKRNIAVMDRCNLTVLFEPEQEGLADFLAQNRVQITASLPCYLQENVDKQRGCGTFDDSIKALQLLNQLGYGQPSSGLELNLVYNPVGPHLPPCQANLESDYKSRLKEDWDIVFNRLFTITNMPITRYAKYLKAFGQYEGYVDLLEASFNAATLPGLMCRNTLNVGWDGSVYDCDFNQALGLKITSQSIMELDIDELQKISIQTGEHCFACTAGAGSSCRGAIGVSS